MTSETAAEAGPAAPFWRRHWQLIALALITIALAVTGVPIMFGTFMAYDDEGYVLLSLRNFAEHGHLYSQVYSQYGPLPFAFYSALHLAGLPLVHVSGRLVTLALWAATAWTCAVCIWRSTRSFVCALLVLAATFVYLWPSVREPTHPGSLVAFILAGMTAWGVHFLCARKWNAWAATAGAGVAALALTKINTGCYAAAACLAFAALHHEHVRVRRWSPWLVGSGFVLLALILMRSHLDAPWVMAFAVLFSASSVSVVGAAAVAGRESFVRITGRHLIVAGFAGTAVAALVLSIIMPRGTSFGDLLEGILLGPLRHPALFSLQARPAALFTPAAISCATLAIAAYYRRGERALIETAIDLLRIAAAVVVLGIFFATDKLQWNAVVFWWVLPWLWLFVWRVDREQDEFATARTWLGLITLGQWLHPYPVPGTQLAWGTLLVLPLALWAACEATRRLARRAPLWLRARKATLVIRGTCAAVAAALSLSLVQIYGIWRTAEPENLPGAAGIRLPAPTVLKHRVLCLNAVVHATTLFSLPGMFSFNLWTGLRTPTLSNATHWFSLLGIAEQRHIIEALESDPRACVIVDTTHVNFLRAAGMPPHGILYDYLTENFAPAFTLDEFEFRVRKGRRVAPFFTGELLQRAPADDDPAAPGALLRVPLIPFPGKKVGRIEIGSAESPTQPQLVLDGASARCEITPINSQGDPVGATTRTNFPFTITTPALLAVYFDPQHCKFSLPRTLIVLRATDGSELALVRLRP